MNEIKSKSSDSLDSSAKLKSKNEEKNEAKRLAKLAKFESKQQKLKEQQQQSKEKDVQKKKKEETPVIEEKAYVNITPKGEKKSIIWLIS